MKIQFVFRLLIAILILTASTIACPQKAGMFANGTIRIPKGLIGLCSASAIKLGQTIAAQTNGKEKMRWSEVYSIKGIDSDVLQNSLSKASYVITDSKELADSGVIVEFSHIKNGQKISIDRRIYVMILPKNEPGPILMVFGNN
jgi:hypothetical protein